MYRKSVHFANAGWRQRQKQQKSFPRAAALSRKKNRPRKILPNPGKAPPRKRVELVDLVPLQWVGGLWDPHWQYKLVVRAAPSKSRRVYECRYSTLRDLLEEKRIDPFVFPTSHWLPRGKVFDSYEVAETRGREMLEALRSYTAADILSVVERLTLVEEEEEMSGSSSGESV